MAGGISSGIGSFTGNILKNAGKFWQGVGVVGSGSISGGIGSRLAGGKFWDGVRQGAITTGLNHFAHKIVQGDPLKKYKDRAISLDKWKEIYQDKSWYDIITERGWKQGQPLGPKNRYVINPIDGNVMDMRHVAVVGYGYGENAGNMIEHIQNLHSSTRPSAYDPQDYYSNKVGAYFYQLRHSGSWSSNSWSYDFSRFVNTHYKSLFNNYTP